MKLLIKKIQKIFSIYWSKYKYAPLMVGFLSLAWFLARVIPKPSRACYPCQQAAISNIAVFFGISTPPFFIKFSKQIFHLFKAHFPKAIGFCLVVILAIPLYHNYQDNKIKKLKILGSRTYNQQVTHGNVKGISTATSVVSLKYDPTVSYGTSSPYGPNNNPAYNLVWQAVEELHLGTSQNPLDELVNPGETVLIELNLVLPDGVAYTHPAVARPIIDMLIAAQAGKIYIGDGGAGFEATEDTMHQTGYQDFINTLKNNTGADIELVNLNDNTKWHWVELDLNTQSSMHGCKIDPEDPDSAGCTDADMGSSNGVMIYGSGYHEYYQTADPQNQNPNGQIMGWYAMSDYVLESDVVINVPKMKSHWTNIATLALKNLIGTTVCSTYDHGDAGWSRVPHCIENSHYGDQLEIDYKDTFGNDVLWRSILDLNKIMLYANKNGILQTTKQRKYLNVLDGIVANQRTGGGGNPYERHVIIASLDPVALDAVASRIMGYDFEKIPAIRNMHQETTYPIGSNDQQNIVIIGHTIDSTFNHIFGYGDQWQDFVTGAASPQVNLDITDFDPPQIVNTQTQYNANGILIESQINAGLVAYVSYDYQNEYIIQKMNKSGNQYSLSIPQGSSNIKVMAQDYYFNSSYYDLPLSQPHIVLTKSAQPNQASQGSTITYTIHYLNDSSNPANTVIISDQIPSGTSYITNTANPPAQFSNNQLVWNFPSLNAGQQGDLMFEVKAD